jgi:hypothetical protein
MFFIRMLGVIALLSSTAVGQGASIEDRVKSALLLNFARYIEWPASVWRSPADPVRVCVIGNDPFHGALSMTLSGHTAQDRPLVYENIRTASQALDCQIVFVSSEADDERSKILEVLREKPVVTVGEGDNFIEQGGMILFRLSDEGKVQFEVNLPAVKSANVKMSSRMLASAEKVVGDRP